MEFVINSPKYGRKIILIDDDMAHLTQYKWHISASRKGQFYIQAQINGRKQRLHTLILPLGIGFCVDHINGDRFDNRRQNLRQSTTGQNSRNSGPKKKRSKIHSRFKGVSWQYQNRNWVARISTENQYKHLGCFLSELDAAKAYNEAALKYHGEFAKLNEVDIGP